MRIKAIIVAYAFAVQCFENTTIVAYAGLGLNRDSTILCKTAILVMSDAKFFGSLTLMVYILASNI